MADVNDLLSRLPTQDQLQRHFYSDDGDARMNVQPYVIARDVPADVFTELLTRIADSDDLSAQFAYIEFESDGTLQVYEMTETWHELVIGSMNSQIARALDRYEIPTRECINTGRGTNPVRQRAPNGNWSPAWSAEELDQIRDMFQGDTNLDPDTGTLLIEVALAETLEHVEDKTQSTWFNPKFSRFPFMVLIVNFGGRPSDRVLNSQQPLQITAKLYHRRTEPGSNQVQVDLMQNIEFGDDCGCDQARLDQFQIQIPFSELLFGTRYAIDDGDQFVNIDLYDIKFQIDNLRDRRRALH